MRRSRRHLLQIIGKIPNGHVLPFRLVDLGFHAGRYRSAEAPQFLASAEKYHIHEHGEVSFRFFIHEKRKQQMRSNGNGVAVNGEAAVADRLLRVAGDVAENGLHMYTSGQYLAARAAFFSSCSMAERAPYAVGSGYPSELYLFMLLSPSCKIPSYSRRRGGQDLPPRAAFCPSVRRGFQATSFRPPR